MSIEKQLESVVHSLNQINENLISISNFLTNTNFWDSSWFSAMIGAGTAIAVISIEKYFSLKNQYNEKLLSFCKWLNEQWTFRSPDSLLASARSTIYGHEEKNITTGEIKIIPEKSLGEKMVIELRRDLKWWREPGFKLKRLFKKYEKLLQKFDNLEDGNIGQEKELLNFASVVFNKIDDYAYKITGDTEHTAI